MVDGANVARFQRGLIDWVKVKIRWSTVESAIVSAAGAF
jgi:hypothetical protein